MRNHKTWAVLALALVVLIGGASILYGKLSGEMLPPDQMAASTEDAEPEKVAAPDFTVYDGTGTEGRLSDYVGKPIVLNFWASWCGPCQSEMPEFDAAYEELGEDIHFLMVNMTDGSRETVETATAFIEEAGYSFPVLYDTESDAAISYQAYSLPTTYFIDAEGYMIARATGALDADTLQQGIDMILS